MGQIDTTELRQAQIGSTPQERQAQVRILDYLNNMLCECEKPASFTIFVTKLKVELSNNELTV
jgi:hypothetical protein